MKKILVLVMALMLVFSVSALATSGTTTCGEDKHTCKTTEAHILNVVLDTANPSRLEKLKTEWLVYDVVAPTCTTEGSYKFDCTKCGTEAIVGDLEALGHEGKGTKKAVHNHCEESYEVWSACTRCTATDVKVAIAGTHNCTATTTAATCEAAATTTYTCNTACTAQGCKFECDYVNTVTVGEANGHKWENMVKAVGATCTTEGCTEGEVPVCTVCGKIDTKNTTAAVIPMLVHGDGSKLDKAWHNYFYTVDAATGKVYPSDWMRDAGETVEPVVIDVVNNGKLTGVYGTPLSDYMKDITYEYVMPNCTEAGYIKVTCGCGYSVTKTMEPVGHFFSKMSIEYNALTHGGMTVEPVIEYFDAMDLVEAIFNGNLGIFADYVEENLTLEIFQMMLEAADTSLADILTWLVKPADCTQPMLIKYVCECGVDCYAESFHATAHDIAYAEPAKDVYEAWDAYYYMQQQFGQAKAEKILSAKGVALCTDYTAYISCEWCKTVVEKQVEGIGHMTNERLYECKVNELYPASCSVEGLKSVKCADLNCEYRVEKAINTLPHTADPKKTVVVDPSCKGEGTKGTRTFTCKDCGATWSEEIPVPAHKEVTTWISRPGCGVKGEWVVTCSTCGDELDRGTTEEKHIVAIDTNDEFWKWSVRNKYAQVGNGIVLANDNYVVDFEVADVERYDANGKLIETVKDAVLIVYEVEDCTKDANLQFNCIYCHEVTATHKAAEAHTLKATPNAEGTPTYAYNVNTKKCTETTVDVYECKVCGELEEVETVVDVAHVPVVKSDIMGVVEYVTIDNSADMPTCTEAGTAWYLCEHCGEYYLDVVEAKGHTVEPKWNIEKEIWEDVCVTCGAAESLEFDAVKFVIDDSAIKYTNKTTGTGVATLAEDLETLPYGTYYAYIQWTWKTKAGNDVIAEKVVELKRHFDEETKEHYFTFDAKGITVYGASLESVLIIVTNDANAEELGISGCTKLGHIVKNV